MPRTAPPRRVSRGRYWELKIQAAASPAEKLAEACDYLRAMAASYPDRAVAQAELTVAADDLIAKAKQLGRKVR